MSTPRRFHMAAIALVSAATSLSILTPEASASWPDSFFDRLTVLDDDAQKAIAAGAFDHARLLLKSQLAKAEAAPQRDNQRLLQVVAQLAYVEERLGNYAQVLSLRRRAVSLSTKRTDGQRARLALADAYLLMGDASSAFRLCQQVERAGAAPVRDLRFLAKCADAARLDGEPRLAARLYGRAAQLASGGDREIRRAMAHVVAGQAQLALELGFWGPVRTELRAFITENDRGDEAAVELVLPLLALSEAEWFAGDLGASRDLAQKALTISERVYSGSHPALAGPLFTLARALRDLGQLADATELEERAFWILRDRLPGDNSQVVDATTTLAATYARLGRLEDARDLLRTPLAKQLARQGDAIRVRRQNVAVQVYDGKHPVPADLRPDSMLAARPDLSRLDHAFAMVAQGQLAMAEARERGAADLFERALAALTNILAPKHPRLAELHHELAGAYLAMGELAKALGQAQTALDLVGEAGSPVRSKILERLARIHDSLGDVPLAVFNLREARAARAEFIRRNSALGELGLAETIEEGRQAASFAIALSIANPACKDARNLAFELTLDHKGYMFDVARAGAVTYQRWAGDDGREAFGEWLTMRRRLAQGSQLSAAAKSTLFREILERERFLRGLHPRRAEAEWPSFAAERLPMIQAALGRDEALVEYAIYQPRPERPGDSLPPRRYAAFVMSGGGLSLRDLEDMEAVDATIARLRFAIAECPRRLDIPEDAPCSYRPPAASLFGSIFRPLIVALGAVKNVNVSPDGSLHMLPFAVLRDERGDLFEQGYVFNHLTSGRDVTRSYRRAPATSLTAFAPAGELADGARTETREVAALFRDHILLQGGEASAARLLRLRGPGVLHISGHGSFSKPAASSATGGDDDLVASGLMFSDGELSALEMVGLDLSGTQLVVLSACESGVGTAVPGEVVYGLRRALLVAGAETIVASLWRVDDRVSRDLITGYYRNLLSGQDRVLALRQAMRSIRARWSHPLYWAPFISIGRRAPLVAGS